MNLLHIDSSVTGDNSVSRQLTGAVVEAWRRAYPQMQVVYRDLATDAPEHLSAERLDARFAAPGEHSPVQREEQALGEAVLDEFLGADVIVLGAPMYNFSIPSQLKAWLDRILVAGRTFRYTEAGPVGLAGGRRVVIASARGGVYSEAAPARVMDHQEAYLEAAMGFIGITDVAVIRAEGVNLPDGRERAIASAHDRIRALVRAAA